MKFIVTSAAAKLPCTPTSEGPKDTSPTFRVAAAEWHAAQAKWGTTNRRLVWTLLEDTVSPQTGDMQMAQITKTMIFEPVVKPFEARGVVEHGERAIGYIRKTYDFVNSRFSTLPDDYNPARNLKFVSRKPTVSRAALMFAPVADLLGAR